MSSDSIGALRERMRTILGFGAALVDALNERVRSKEEDVLVPFAFLRKVMGCLGAVDKLIDSGFEKEAQILVRALIEVRINFEYFFILAKDNPKKALARVIDAKMLEKLKALKATDFKLGESQVDKERWRQIEEEIKGRHSKQEIEVMRSHGFAGIPLEARALKTGNKPLYDFAYRLYSGHVHATDIHEQLGSDLTPEWIPQLEERLLPAVLEISCDCAATVVRRCNEWTGNPLGISE